MRIIGFSPRVYEEVSRFFREHPVVEIRVLRAADMGSRCVPVPDRVCDRCGFVWRPTKLYVETLRENLRGLGEEMPAGTLPEDYLEAVEVRHAWDQASRSMYCGGVMQLARVPV